MKKCNQAPSLNLPAPVKKVSRLGHQRQMSESLLMGRSKPESVRIVKQMEQNFKDLSGITGEKKVSDKVHI